MSGVPVVSDHETTTATTAGKASLWRVVRDQRKTIFVAAGLSVATYWILGSLGEWLLAGCIVGGVALGLINHLATEYWLLRIITSGEEPTRHRLAVSTLVRLLVLSVVAVTSFETAHQGTAPMAAGASMEGKEARFGVPAPTRGATAWLGTVMAAISARATRKLWSSCKVSSRASR